MADDTRSQHNNQCQPRLNKPSTLDRPKPMQKTRPAQSPLTVPPSNSSADNDAHAIKLPTLKPATLPRKIDTKPVKNDAVARYEVHEKTAPSSGPVDHSAAKSPVAVEPPSIGVSDTLPLRGGGGGSGRGKSTNSPTSSVGAARPNAPPKPTKPTTGQPSKPVDVDESGHRQLTSPGIKSDESPTTAGTVQRQAIPPWVSQLKKNKMNSGIDVRNNVNNDVVDDKKSITTNVKNSTSSPLSEQQTSSPVKTLDVNASSEKVVCDDATRNKSETVQPQAIPSWVTQLKKNKVNSGIEVRNNASKENNDVINKNVVNENISISSPLKEQQISSPTDVNEELLYDDATSSGSETVQPQAIPPRATQLKMNKVNSGNDVRNNFSNDVVDEKKSVTTDVKNSTFSPLSEQQTSPPREHLDVNASSEEQLYDDATSSGTETVASSSTSKPPTVTPKDSANVIVMVGGKSYRRKRMPDEVTAKPPRKPARPPLVDLSAYRQNTVNHQDYSDDDGDIYDDVAPSCDVTSRKTRAISTISRISEFTEEEEIGYKQKQNVFEDEIYQDVGNTVEEDGLTYEELN